MHARTHTVWHDNAPLREKHQYVLVLLTKHDALHWRGERMQADRKRPIGGRGWPPDCDQIARLCWTDGTPSSAHVALFVLSQMPCNASRSKCRGPFLTADERCPTWYLDQQRKRSAELASAGPLAPRLASEGPHICACPLITCYWIDRGTTWGWSKIRSKRRRRRRRFETGGGRGLCDQALLLRVRAPSSSQSSIPEESDSSQGLSETRPS